MTIPTTTTTTSSSSNDSNTNNKIKVNRLKFHQPREGYTTAAVQWDYCEQNPDDANCGPIDASNEYNLTAGDDPGDPLRFWQLYSVLGEEPVYEIVRDFYRRVFADDDEPWFRDAFTKIAPYEHHVATQAAYWIDAMGGGRRYHGGEYRLHFHHAHNAKEVMTAAGANRWMYHMRKTLEGVKFEDPRVKPCLIDFLRTKMQTYASQFGWKYNDDEMILYQD